MTRIDVDGLTFDFPTGWRASKYDEWSFYRNQFARMRGAIKAVDLIADDGATAWFIEVKDYRTHARTKPTELGLEVHQKVFDTLAALLPASANANDADERAFARGALRLRKLRVVLHVEQPVKHSKLFPRPIDPANLKQKLRRLLKAIDAHPFVAERTRMGSLGWTVR